MASVEAAVRRLVSSLGGEGGGGQRQAAWECLRLRRIVIPKRGHVLQLPLVDRLCGRDKHPPFPLGRTVAPPLSCPQVGGFEDQVSELEATLKSVCAELLKTRAAADATGLALERCPTSRCSHHRPRLPPLLS